ncbi:MAG: hypothetical protein ACI36X_02185 [Bacteroidaceae bacterium]
MIDIQSYINDLTCFMQTDVFASLEETTKAALVKKKVALCRDYFLRMASNLNRNKYKGCFAPHKAVMLISIMELVESGHITTNIVCLDKELRSKFEDVWQRVVPIGSPFICGHRNPFIYMASEPFWHLSNEKNNAFISSEAFYAFSHEESRRAIKDFLIDSIREDSISEQYKTLHLVHRMAAEDLLAFAPVLGFFMAI